jgi:hypothetical protein
MPQSSSSESGRQISSKYSLLEAIEHTFPTWLPMTK